MKPRRRFPCKQKKHKERHKRKLDNFLVKQSYPECNGSHKVVNLSTKQLDEPYFSVPCKGLNLPLHPS